MPTLAERCRGIELLVLDVDGVLSAGGIWQGAIEGQMPAPLEGKEFHVRDGLGLRIWREAGKDAVIISGRDSIVVHRRATEVGIREVLQGVGDKGKAAFVGDDIIDAPALRLSGLGVAVADACTEAILAAHHVTHRPGGRGAVREVIELILRCQGKWPSI
jgi:3-deoxy-D-manno-octulosonate 8-phosphate phosphatase (KDO 8-P phosphatase)